MSGRDRREQRGRLKIVRCGASCNNCAYILGLKCKFKRRAYLNHADLVGLCDFTRREEIIDKWSDPLNTEIVGDNQAFNVLGKLPK